MAFDGRLIYFTCEESYWEHSVDTYNQNSNAELGNGGLKKEIKIDALKFNETNHKWIIKIFDFESLKVEMPVPINQIVLIFHYTYG